MKLKQQEIRDLTKIDNTDKGVWTHSGVIKLVRLNALRDKGLADEFSGTSKWYITDRGRRVLAINTATQLYSPGTAYRQGLYVQVMKHGKRCITMVGGDRVDYTFSSITKSLRTNPYGRREYFLTEDEWAAQRQHNALWAVLKRRVYGRSAPDVPTSNIVEALKLLGFSDDEV